MKDSIYFSHDADARSDEKIISLIMAHGYEGYGIFWAIIEMLRTATNYKMQMDFKRIAFALHVDSKKVESIICDFELFDCIGGLHNLHECKDDLHKKTFYSKSLNRRMKLKESISEKRRQAAMARWNGDAKAMQMHSNSSAEAEQVQCNKGKKGKKENKIKKEKKYSDDSMRVAEYLLKCILEHKPNLKKPNLESWAKDIDKAIRIDNRTPRELCEVAKWATQDEFWQPNILSGKKLRAHFDALQIKMNTPQNQTMEQHGQEWLALAED